MFGKHQRQFLTVQFGNSTYSSRQSCLENTTNTVSDSYGGKILLSQVWKILQTQSCWQLWKILQTQSCWQLGLENIEDSSCRWRLESSANSYRLPRYIKYSKHGSWQSGLKKRHKPPWQWGFHDVSLQLVTTFGIWHTICWTDASCM